MHEDISRNTQNHKCLLFKRIPNGKYVVKYKDEKICEDDLIIVVLEIVKGEFRGEEIPIKFSGPKAKNVITAASCDFVSRLSFEGSKLAHNLDDIFNLSYRKFGKYGNKIIEFLVRVNDGLVVTVYSYNKEEITRFRRRIASDPDFKGEKKNKPKYKIALNKFINVHLTLNIIAELPDATETSKGASGIYEINLFQMTCTCPDFKKRRQYFDKNDIRRPCKHLLNKLTRKKLLGKHDELTQCIIDYSPIKEKIALNHMTSGEAVIFCYNDYKWIDVFTRKRKKGDKGGKYTGAYDMFGFNVEETRWSYGYSPPGALEIRAMIKGLK